MLEYNSIHLTRLGGQELLSTHTVKVYLDPDSM